MATENHKKTLGFLSIFAVHLTVFALFLFITCRGKFPMVIDNGFALCAPFLDSHVPSVYRIIGSNVASCRQILVICNKTWWLIKQPLAFLSFWQYRSTNPQYWARRTPGLRIPWPALRPSPWTLLMLKDSPVTWLLGPKCHCDVPDVKNHDVFWTIFTRTVPRSLFGPRSGCLGCCIVPHAANLSSAPPYRDWP